MTILRPNKYDDEEDELGHYELQGGGGTLFGDKNILNHLISFFRFSSVEEVLPPPPPRLSFLPAAPPVLFPAEPPPPFLLPALLVALFFLVLAMITNV